MNFVNVVMRMGAFRTDALKVIIQGFSECVIRPNISPDAGYHYDYVYSNKKLIVSAMV